MAMVAELFARGSNSVRISNLCFPGIDVGQWIAYIDGTADSILKTGKGNFLLHPQTDEAGSLSLGLPPSGLWQIFARM